MTAPRLSSLLLTGVLLLAGLVAAGSPGVAVQAAPTPGSYARAATDATNAQRAAQGLRTLRTDRCLRRMAVAQARRMAEQGSMFHQPLGPVLSGCRASTVGENVAYGYGSGASVVDDGWMNSDGHRANILNRRYRLMGIGARRGTDGRWYVAQVFGRR